LKKVLPEVKPKKLANDFLRPVNELKMSLADSKTQNRGNWRSNKV